MGQTETLLINKIEGEKTTWLPLMLIIKALQNHQQYNDEY